MRNILFSTIIICLSALHLRVSCGAVIYVRKGDKAIALGEYYLAADNYR